MKNISKDAQTIPAGRLGNLEVRGSQIILDDPSGNPVELFQPASKR